ncbi:hypothetical protein BGW36DRAFT_425989 [Talaromyces proteolyticus]|uniref:DUF7707 domain-containing protein n=1 Tax=Talaromyces proteolyticus TaxID=1131652 RepID=A0AAD4PWM3_9EURO|nr:uncharacterized protein BGW36DRAFT_425989 [Talaromyces proteolyticus]KAH8698277.1 hypothetical protein BGW36DRAFT_425989 [Talaromyces proteolyticus]
MRASAAVLIFAAFVARTTAYYNYTFPAGFNLGLISQSDLSNWCLGERNTCPQICGGAASPNDCDPTTLNFDCTCINGTVPDVSIYINTIPFYVCQANFAQCIKNHPNDQQGQDQCSASATCGSLTASVASSTTSTSSVASSTSTSVSKVTTSASPTAATASATSTHTGAAVALHAAQDHSVGFVAAGALAVFGLMI